MLLYVYFAGVKFYPFSLPLGVRVWLPLVLVSLPGLFQLSFLQLKLRYFSFFVFFLFVCLLNLKKEEKKRIKNIVTLQNI